MKRETAGVGPSSDKTLDKTTDECKLAKKPATMASCALLSLVISIVAGMLGALYYVPSFFPFLKERGIQFQTLRPLHTLFAAGWIYVSGASMVYFFLIRSGRFQRLQGNLYRVQMVLWGVAALGGLISLSLGIFSGREYLEFPPIFSLFILGGWFIFAWNFFSQIKGGFWGQPVYIYMWSASIIFFTYTFFETHSWLLPWIWERPLVDLQIQWKSAGLMVGSFNLLVYGTIAYLGEEISQDRKSAHSFWVFALFWLGLLNSLTNYTHHTYHIPQREIVKWIGFSISMTESIILIKVISDLIAMMRAQRKDAGELSTTMFLMRSAKWWTAGNLALAIIISIPPINTLIHGTHVVFAHAMGSMIGIDTMALFAGLSYMLVQWFPRRVEKRATVPMLWVAQWSLVGLVGVMTFFGTFTGVTRYLEQGLPEGVSNVVPYLFALCALGLALSLLGVATHWIIEMWPIVRGEAETQTVLKKLPSPVEN